MSSTGSVSRFELGLTDDRTVFHAGETLTGTVELDLNETTRIRGVRLVFEGYATVRFTISIQYRHTDGMGRTTTRSSNSHFKNDQTILEQTTWLWERETLDAGRHELPFSCRLGRDFPDTYEDHVGRIRYTVEATVEGQPSLYPRKMDFTVVSLDDLNIAPLASVLEKPLSTQQSKSLCACFQKVSASFWTDRTGYIPGDVIRYHVEVDNGSGTYRSCEIKLIKCMSYYTSERNKKEKDLVVWHQVGNVGARSCESWSDRLLTVPPLPPTGLSGCQIMDVRYFIKLTVEAEGRSFTNLELPLDIFIGVLPQQDHTRTTLTSSDISIVTQTVAEQGGKNAPPTYQEVMEKDANM